MNKKKYNLYVVLWGILLILLQSITVFSNLEKYNFFKVQQITVNIEAMKIAIAVGVVMIIVLLLYLVLSLSRKKIGPILGIFAGIIYFLMGGIIEKVLGVCFIVSCFDMIKELKKEVKIH